MTDDVLGDLRRQVEEINKKTPRFAPLVLGTGVVLLLAFLLLALFEVTRDVFRDRNPQPVDSWRNVEALADRSDLAKAYEMALRLESKATNDFLAFSQKGDILTRMGKLEAALTEYRRAYDLYPDENISERVETVRKALQTSRMSSVRSDGTAADVPNRQP